MKRFQTHSFLKFTNRRSLNLLTALLMLLQGTAAVAQDAGTSVTSTATTETLLQNQAQQTYSDGNESFSNLSNTTELLHIQGLIDPRGQVLGCNGQVLEDYSGFKVALFEPNPSDPTKSTLGRLLDLTPTEVPDNPSNNIPKGLTPNTNNINPYPLSTQEEGRYSFLLDRSRGQLSVGTVYILVVTTPSNQKIYSQRRVRLEITSITPMAGTSLVQYVARALDGLPLGVEGQEEINQSVVLINDAERVGLQLLALQFTGTLCQLNQIEIRKSGDRANAAPGDTILYRLSAENVSDGKLASITFTDTLPAGFQFLGNSVIAELNGQVIPLTVTQNERIITFSTSEPLPVEGNINIIYAAQLTPDALRGNGENSAIVQATRADSNFVVQDGPAIHRVRLNRGIVSNCGTIFGRVFVDHNFDGQQQKGEPGVPNAVVFMDDGNRITADEDGVFSVKCVLPGRRTGILDLTSIPDYTLAPNVKFIEWNSPSRLVTLSPGGAAKMNFAVTPVTGEETQE